MSVDEASAPVEAPRYHALDRVRASAMLLGVVYHSLLFRMFAGGRGGGPPGPPGMGGGAERYFEDWLHSFRMPLFFLISGFFGRMMLRKYGLRRYLLRRWVRIGVPLFVGLFTFGPAFVLTRDAVAPMGGPGGGPPRSSPGGPRPEGPPTGDFPAPPGMEAGDGFGPGPGPGVGPGPGGVGGPDGGRRRGPGGRGPGGPPGGGPGGPGGPMGGGGAMAQALFGSYASMFQLNHLWFLWYLFLFVTVAPWITQAIGGLIPSGRRALVDDAGSRLIRSGLAPMVFGLASAPVLMAAGGGFGGWSLGMPGSIFTPFPDFLFRLDALMPFYFLYFLTGWWLHREREALPSLARAWFPQLVLGLAAFAAATWLSGTYGRRSDVSGFAAIRMAGYGLYCIGSAATGAAFIGFFQKYLDRPSPTWRYLADTALWVYLAHQPFVVIALVLLAPLGLPWWLNSAATTILSAASTLVLYEALVRPTFLARLFGPAVPGRARLVLHLNRRPEAGSES